MAAAVAASAAVVVVGWWEVRWGAGVGRGDTGWCRLAAWPVCSLETACSTAWWRLVPRARGRRRQETSRRGRSRVAEGPPRPLGSAGCPLAVVSQGARGAQCGAVPRRGGLMWRAAARSQRLRARVLPQLLARPGLSDAYAGRGAAVAHLDLPLLELLVSELHERRTVDALNDEGVRVVVLGAL